MLRFLAALWQLIIAWKRGVRRVELDEHTADLLPADRAETFTKAIPPKPKRRTAKRGPVPPESLSGGQ